MSLLNRFLLALTLTAALACAGCSRDRVKTDQPAWVVQHPSPAVRRAARTLRPLSPEILNAMARRFPGGKQGLDGYCRTIPVIYELFGTLSPEQLRQFRARDRVFIPMRSLTPEQRRLVEKWFDLWQKEMTAAPANIRDLRPVLQQIGVKKDLSNLEVGFIASSNLETGLTLMGQSVSFAFRLQGTKGRGHENNISIEFAEL